MRESNQNNSLAKLGPSGNPDTQKVREATVEAIVVESLTCERGGRTVLSEVSFQVKAGSCLLLRGPNGSGKTTLLRTIAGFLTPAAGIIRVVRDSSKPPHSVSPPEVREDARNALPVQSEAASPSLLWERAGVRGDSHDAVFHYIGHSNGLKQRLSVLENLSFWQRYYSGREDLNEAETALEAFGLLNLADFSAGHLSQGQARRLGLARLLASYRAIWLLDEPSVSLDTASTQLLEVAIRAHLSDGGIAIIATHLDLSLPGSAVLELGAPRMQP
ncbi:MAG: heme ABC exporter ATP-binding protein CcmA [Rhodomicrobium sp.]